VCALAAVRLRYGAMPAKLCPMCHARNVANEWQCRCGYEFGQNIDTVLELLRDQRTNARIMLVVLIFLDLAAVGAVIYMAIFHRFVVYSVLGFAALFLATLRTARRLAITRKSLAQLSRRELPKAVVRAP